MRVLVTGAGGFVGGAVATMAALRGHDVLATARRPLASRQDLCVAALDLHDKLAVGELLADFQPEAIVHAAWSKVFKRAESTPEQALADIAATLTLINVGARHALVRFVGMGSQAEYGAIEGPTREDTPLAPASWYGSAKVAAYHLACRQCAETSVSFAWARLFATFGPGDNPTWLIPSVVADICAGRRPRTTSGRQLWDYLFIDDVAAAIIALCETCDARGAFNLGSGRAISVRSLVESIRDKVAPNLPLVFGEVPHRPDQIWHLQADITKLCSSIDWAPRVSLDEGLNKTIDAFRRSMQPASR